MNTDSHMSKRDTIITITMANNVLLPLEIQVDNAVNIGFVSLFRAEKNITTATSSICIIILMGNINSCLTMMKLLTVLSLGSWSILGLDWIGLIIISGCGLALTGLSVDTSNHCNVIALGMELAGQVPVVQWQDCLLVLALQSRLALGRVSGQVDVLMKSQE